MDFFQEALSSNLSPSGKALAHYYLGEIASAIPNPSEAIEQFNDCIEADPGSSLSCYARWKKGLVLLLDEVGEEQGLAVLDSVFNDCSLPQMKTAERLMEEAQSRLNAPSVGGAEPGKKGGVKGLSSGINKLLGSTIKSEKTKKEILIACSLLKILVAHCKDAPQREEALFELGKAYKHTLLHESKNSLQAFNQLLMDYPRTDFPAELEKPQVTLFRCSFFSSPILNLLPSIGSRATASISKQFLGVSQSQYGSLSSLLAFRISSTKVIPNPGPSGTFIFPSLTWISS